MSKRIQIAILAALAVSGCATPGPYAEVTGERLSVSDATEEPVQIVGVGGRLLTSGPTSVAIEPGTQMLLVRTTRRDGRRVGPDAMLPLNAKPCMRYYVVAKHESQLTVEPWWLEIKKVEPIAECLAKFPNGEQPKGGA